MSAKEFKNPGKEYRPSPFWSWNDALDPEELRWQVREFADKGFGGYFMHARTGLATPYLSNEWMNCIQACLEEGKKTGMESWLYDEDKWPSGFAGGLVPAKSDEYRARYVSMNEIVAEDLPKAFGDPNLLGLFEVEFSSPAVMKAFKRLHGPEDFGGAGRLFLFKVEIMPCSNWYNGESYVDLLNPEVTEEFLKVTLDAYAERFKRDFGEFMPGIFTDEPNYIGAKYLPWTGEMVEYFGRLNGYDVSEKLPLLGFEGKGSCRVRCDFWRTVTQRFVEAFTLPYSKRCEALGLKMTGHYLYEDNLLRQIVHIGAAMPHYEYMHVLGIDHLGRNIDNPLTLKQCSSVAHQFGRNRVLSELFGCSGQSMTFEDQKWLADFHLALGITFFCPHLTLYTMKGDAKRDYPPTFSYHQPYWEHLKVLNDYFARASYLCSQGQFCTDMLVLHSIGSAWAVFTPMVVDKDSATMKYNEALVKLQDNLLATHWDFDFGDEIILSRHGHVEGKALIVRESQYKVVVVPPSLTWSSDTVKLLKQLLDSGGKVLFVGEHPSLINGESSEATWQEICAHPNAVSVEADRSAVAEALDNLLPKPVSVTDGEGNEIGDIFVHHRVDGSRHMYFFANKSRSQKYDATIRLSEKGEVTEWNMFDGSILPVSTPFTRKETIINAVFYPVGSRAFIVDTARTPAAPQLPIQPRLEEIKLPKEWMFSRLHPNSMVLDSCQYSLGGGKWSGKLPVWKVRLECMKKTGLEKYIGIQPWVLLEKKVEPDPLEVKIRTTFKSEVRGKKVFLVLEKAPLWNLAVNGTAVSTKVVEWQWDKQFGKVDISKQVKEGLNVVELSCRYSLDLHVENLCLVGEFGVKKVSDTEYVLTDEPKALENGDWVNQGYPFYTGTMRYKTKFLLEEGIKPEDRVLVRLPEAKGTLFLVKVNGKGPVPVCWQPLEADVTNIVQSGENELSVDVVGSLRNTFGPLHHRLGDPYSVGPNTFVDERNWVDTYQLVPYGLTKGVQIIIENASTKE